MSNGKGVLLTGKLINIFPTERIGQFEKRVIWLQEIKDKYPETWQIEFQQGDVNTLDNFKTGQTVEVTIDIKGRSWSKNEKTSVFNTLKATGIKAEGNSKPEPSNRQKTGRPDLDTTVYNDGGAIDF